MTWADTFVAGDPRPRDGKRWGPWEFNEHRFVLVYRGKGTNGYPYEVDLDECIDSAHILDWLAQLSGKGWVSDADLGHLFRALDALLYFQANYCSWGQHKVMNPREAWRRL